MTVSTFQLKLEELRDQLSALERSDGGQSVPASESRPEALGRLHRLLDDLAASLAAGPAPGRADSRASAKPKPARSGGAAARDPIARRASSQAEKLLSVQYAVARLLSQAKTLDQTVAPILQLLCERMGWELGELWSVHPQNREPRFIRFWASPAVDVTMLEEGMWTRVFPPLTDPSWRSGAPVWIPDMSVHGSLRNEPEVKRVGLHGMFHLPVMVHGEIRGILRFFCRGIRTLDDAEIESMVAAGSQIGQALERQRSMQRVLEAEARKAAILEASLDAVITIDTRGLVVEFNPAAESVFGYRRDDAVGHELLDLIVPLRMRDRARAGLASYQAAGENALPIQRFGAFAMKSDGSEFPVEVAIAPVGVGEQPLLTIYLCDASARERADRDVKHYQERVRSLMTDLLLAEEHERRRLAVDLHDGLSQVIALTQIKLSQLRNAMDGKLVTLLDEIDALVVQSNLAARSIGSELSPPILHDLGLEPAVHWLVESIHRRYGIKIELQVVGRAQPTDERTRVVLFRSIRELLINAAKHAEARRVLVFLECETNRLNAAIEDDGVGMAPEATSVRGSGLFSIRERLSHVGGSMRIDSEPGRGTKVRLSVPLPKGNRAVVAS